MNCTTQSFPNHKGTDVENQKPLVEADSWLFSKLLQKGFFEVPWHQRYYDWKPNHVRELLADIEEAVTEERHCYFLGTVILVKKDPTHWEINDGQQRMITFSLICATLCRKFADEAQGQHVAIALRVLFDLDPDKPCSLDNSQKYTPRISPQRNDAVSYWQMIRGESIGANSVLTDAWKEIDRFIESQSLEQSKKYFEFLVEKLEIACLQVPPEVDPNAVYETINCRGKILDDLDLIRNHIYSHFTTDGNHERRNSVHVHLEIIRTRLSANRASEYMRCHLQCVFGFLRKDSFYRSVRKEISHQVQETNQHPADYMFGLTEKVADPKSLCLFSEVMISPNPNLKFVEAFNIDCGATNLRRNLAVFLWELRAYKVTQPLVFALLTAYLHETDGRRKKRIAKTVNKNLSRLATFVLRTAFVAPKFEPSYFEAEFSNFAKKIMQGTKIPNEEFVGFLRDCDHRNFNILDDSEFKEKISEAQMTGDSRVKRFLFGINSNQQGDFKIFNDSQFTVEHILPKSNMHWEGWKGFKEEDPKGLVNKIGNITLLGKTDNKPGIKYNGSFEKKKEVYAESAIAITRQLAQFTDWTPKSIKKRQLGMAKRAVEVWKFV